VFAFILKSSGYQAGPTTLSADVSALKDLRLEVSAAAPAMTKPSPPAFIAGVASATPAPGRYRLEPESRRSN
jgi:hypothetical protein